MRESGMLHQRVHVQFAKALTQLRPTTLLCLLVVSGIHPDRVRSGAREARADRGLVELTAADGRLLVEDALAQATNNSFRLTLLAGGAGFVVDSPRVIIRGTAAISPTSSVICPIAYSGRPIVVDNRIALDSAEVTTDGTFCGIALVGLRSRVLAALRAHPWNLAGRLARASADRTLPGPRLAVKGCRSAEQIQLRGILVKPAMLHVEVDFAAGPLAGPCP